MNEETKLLLMSYVDGELNEAESLVAEGIIETEARALDFVNKLKQANIQIDAFYESQKNKEIENELYQFLEKDILKRKSPQSSFIENIFNLRPVFNYSLTALFFLSAGLFYDDFLNQTSVEFDLNESVYTKKVYKTRGFVASNTLSEIIEITINEMLDKRSSKAILIYADQEYEIILSKKVSETAKLSCYLGELSNTSTQEIEDREIKFCKSIDDSSIIFF